MTHLKKQQLVNVTIFCHFTNAFIIPVVTVSCLDDNIGTGTYEIKS